MVLKKNLYMYKKLCYSIISKENLRIFEIRGNNNPETIDKQYEPARDPPRLKQDSEVRDLKFTR